MRGAFRVRSIKETSAFWVWERTQNADVWVNAMAIGELGVNSFTVDFDGDGAAFFVGAGEDDAVGVGEESSEAVGSFDGSGDDPGRRGGRRGGVLLLGFFIPVELGVEGIFQEFFHGFFRVLRRSGVGECRSGHVCLPRLFLEVPRHGVRVVGGISRVGGEKHEGRHAKAGDSHARQQPRLFHFEQELGIPRCLLQFGNPCFHIQSGTEHQQKIEEIAADGEGCQPDTQESKDKNGKCFCQPPLNQMPHSRAKEGAKRGHDLPFPIGEQKPVQLPRDRSVSVDGFHRR